MVSPHDDHVVGFLAAAATNMCSTLRVVGVAAGTEEVVKAVRRHASDGLVALPVGDALLDALGVEDALTESGCDVLRADDAEWRGRLPDAVVGVTGAAVAVAEQGVVGLACGPGSPRGTSLLPPVHVCVVRASDVVATFGDGIRRVGESTLPSALTWVGGPSRTGDLGMTLTLGVHGPGAVEIVVVDLQ